jgi:hypothetical protein
VSDCSGKETPTKANITYYLYMCNPMLDGFHFFFVRTFKVFSLILKMKLEVFTKCVNFYDNLHVSSLPCENRLFENFKGYHLEVEGLPFMVLKKACQFSV